MSKNKQIMEMAKNLRIKAGVMALGERIEWGSDTALMEEAAALLETLIAAALEPPAGWKLVPIEPTEEMNNAGDDLLYDTVECAHNVWNAMLSAVPATEGER